MGEGACHREETHDRRQPARSEKTEISKRSETLGRLAKGLAILEVFSISHQRLSISEASRLTDHIASDPRGACLRTLEQLGFVAFGWQVLQGDGPVSAALPRPTESAAAEPGVRPLPPIAARDAN